MAGRISWQAKLAQGFEYSNSNYIALALIVERLSGRRIGEVISTDIIEPLGLSETSMTAAGPAPSSMVHGYIALDRKQLDVTYPAAQIDNAAGGMVSSVADVNTFYRALLQNRLLKPATITQMESPLYARYGLGVVRWNDLCTNDFYYGHPGDVPGYGTIAMTSADGTRQLTMAVAYPPEPLRARGHPHPAPNGVHRGGHPQRHLHRPGRPGRSTTAAAGPGNGSRHCDNGQMTAIILVWNPDEWNDWTYPAVLEEVAETGRHLASWEVGTGSRTADGRQRGRQAAGPARTRGSCSRAATGAA